MVPVQELKYLTNRMINEVWNKGNVEILDDITYPNVGVHDPDDINANGGLEFGKQLIELYREAFPDITFCVLNQIGEDNIVFTRWEARGTHLGDLKGIPPTGKKITIEGMVYDRYRDDKLIESRINWDGIGLLSQIGVLPEMKW